MRRRAAICPTCSTALGSTAMHCVKFGIEFIAVDPAHCQKFREDNIESLTIKLVRTNVPGARGRICVIKRDTALPEALPLRTQVQLALMKIFEQVAHEAVRQLRHDWRGKHIVIGNRFVVGVEVPLSENVAANASCEQACAIAFAHSLQNKRCLAASVN